ncbi:RNA-guided endonuclease TnpB family protein [Natrinema hispanicum]|uniref:Putative transposase n=1 Tax=Natrinema hispanicum TaxID=392421 RepID=A0A1I0JHR8_9EURY|nr:RNA-guided endonuclease TnpB family protein [Natrinema hispanicum]SEU09570.1 putative transposase [Natrinema hispanicum]
MRTVRTFEASIANPQQVGDDLDQLGWAASKLWNVSRYYAQEQWDDTGEIPDDGELKAELKGHERYTDLHSQSSQRVLEELAEAFTGWFAKRRDGDSRARPPGYRKRGDSHPRSTVTFKAAGFKHDAQFTRVRLSKGRNLKEHRSDFVLCEYELRPDVDLTEWDIQQVRAVYTYEEWRLQFICRKSIDPDPPGDGVAGVDLGISNIAALSFGSESILFPGNALKEDEYYFGKQKAKCDDSRSNERLRLDRKRTERRTHFLHTLSKQIVSECVERGVGTIVVGDLEGIRDNENGESRNWGSHGNLDLHGWAFDRFTSILDYKAETEGIDVLIESERDTSKTCSACGTKDGNQRVERGLYVCEECDTVANADVNGAENIRQKVTPSPSQDRSNGWLAQPSVHLFDRSEGRFAPREQVVDCKP